MRRAAVTVIAVLALVVGACGGGGDDEDVVLEPNDDQGLQLAVRHSEPLRARAPVTWTLEVRNIGAAPVTVTFSSGQKGDVALYQGGQERYRWSNGKVFTEAFSETAVAPGQALPFELKEPALNVAPGQYELVGGLSSGPAPPEVRQPVTVG